MNSPQGRNGDVLVTQNYTQLYHLSEGTSNANLTNRICGKALLTNNNTKRGQNLPKK